MSTITTSLKFTLGFGIIAPLGLLGMFISFKDWRKFLILYTFLGVYLVSILIMYNISRYRVPAVPVLIVFAAWYLDWLYTAFKEKKTRNASISIACLILLFVGVNHRIDGMDPYKIYFPTEYRKLGKTFLAENRLEEAKESYNNILKIDPTLLQGYVGLGKVAMKKKNYPEAIKLFEKVIAMEPSDYLAYLSLAGVYRQQGKYREAQGMLEKAARLNPNIYKIKPLL